MSADASTKPDFSKEDLKGTAVEFAPNAWVCGELHYAGGIKNFPVNNRAFVFRLKLSQDLAGVEQGDDCLFVFGLGKKPIIEGVKQLEKKTGLKAVALLCNGSGHHIQLKYWYDAFPEMAIWVAPTKPPQTANGERLIKEYADRWELMDNSTVPHHVNQLYHYFGQGDDLQVDCVLFNQLYGYSDKTSKEAGAWCEIDDEPKVVGSSFVFTGFTKQGKDKSTPMDDTVFYHKASKLIVTGHHWEFMYCPPDYVMPAELSDHAGAWAFKLVMSQIIHRGRYSSFIKFMGRLRDMKIHAAQWQEVMKWDYEYGTGHHDPVGVCGPVDNAAIMKGQGGLKGHMKRELQATGELTGEAVARSWWPWKRPNALHKIQKDEAGFRKRYGEPPVLPMGGPDYDARGMKK